jgi:hypothetical protein
MTGTSYSSGCAALGKRRLDAASRRAAPKITPASPAENAYGYSSAEWNVSRRGSPPDTGMTNTSKLPKRSLANAMLRPSRLQAGMKSCAGCVVNRTAVPPLDATR